MSRLYFKVTNDQYELPIGVCERSEIPEVHGIEPMSARGRSWKSVINEEELAVPASGTEPPKVKQKRKVKPRKPDAEFVNGYYKRINELLKERGSSAYQLHKEYPDIHPQMFNNEGHSPSCRVLIIMSKTFNVSVDYLLGLTDKRSVK